MCSLPNHLIVGADS